MRCRSPPPDGAIEITLSLQDDMITALILDQGPGILESERDAVFERFHSVRPEAESFGDHSGLGLGIARTIIEAHDGTLELLDPPAAGLEGDRDSAQGACFAISLPTAEAE